MSKLLCTSVTKVGKMEIIMRNELFSVSVRPIHWSVFPDGRDGNLFDCLVNRHHFAILSRNLTCGMWNFFTVLT